MGRARRRAPKRTLKPVQVGLSSNGKMSHATLSKGFREIGEKITAHVDAQGKITRIDVGTNPKQYNFETGKQKASKGWGTFYRGLDKGKDELMSTATVRELVNGLSKGNLTVDQQKAIAESLNNVSAARLPTEDTGFSSNQRGTLQHPTGANTGMWSDKTVEGEHYSLDLQRREEVYKAMEEEASKGSSSAQNVIQEGLKRSMTFTLNEFVASATAKDQNPVSRRSAKERYEQNYRREQMKEEAVRLGAPREAGTDFSRDREAGDRRGRRDISPERRMEPADEAKLRPHRTLTATPATVTPVLAATPAPATIKPKKTVVKDTVVTGTIVSVRPQRNSAKKSPNFKYAK